MKLSLVQRVFVAILVLFITSSAVLSFVVAGQTKQAFLEQQKRSVAEFVRKQASKHLSREDFQANVQNGVILPRFVDYQNEILTPEIVRTKIYNTNGVVLYSDQTELIGRNLFADDPGELNEILEGKIVIDIADLNKPENVFEKQYKQLLEIYTPIYFSDSNVDGIIETYYNLDFLNNQVRQSQINLILAVTAIFTILFILLFVIVRSASSTLIEQDNQLKKDILKEQEYSLLKDEFIRESSHELRTPTTAIKWSIEVLKNGIDKFSKEQKDVIESMDTNIQSLVSIINNLLIIAELKPDYFIFEKTAYSLFDLTQGVIKNNAEKIKTKNLTINLPAPQNIKNINFRKDAIERVLNILIDNALDYTPNNGQISIQIVQKEKSQVFEIKDTGIGIPENEKTKIFGKFFRASNSVALKNVGSGMSLYIAKRIIEAYGGKIGFESGGNGSRFVFEIANV